MIQQHKDDQDCQCVFCKNNIPFDLPDEIYKELIKGNVVIFAGAGISTENHLVMKETLYESVCYDLNLDIASAIPFPDLMTKYCSNSNGKKDLFIKIKKRFDYLKGFPELYGNATRFHEELSTVYFITSIITTNWDNYFEETCGALPIVEPQDFAFWDLPIRKVFKIHGSMTSLSSIIATREDYEKCFTDLSSGIIGSNLKVLLATKTLVYIGFSFTDDDFLRIHNSLRNELGGVQPKSYIISLDKNSEQRFRDSGLIPIFTSGEYFIRVIKEKLIKEERMLDDIELSKAFDFLLKIHEIHLKFSENVDYFLYPDVIYTTSFQDGLIHALQRIHALKNTGYYSNPINIINSVDSYYDIRKKYVSRKKYFDVAYIDGYITGLTYLLMSDKERTEISPFYVYGYSKKIDCLQTYNKIIQNSSIIHKAAHLHAIKTIKLFNPGDQINLHHPPFLS